jgi:hemoglobin-like flavoprotein
MELNIKTIQDSFAEAKPIANDVVTHFYSTLWTDYPESRALFAKVDMERQKKQLIASLVYIVDHLSEPERLQSYLEAMGERHARYGTEDIHFEWVGASLLKTFAYFFGDQWTDELAGQWTLAINAIATHMKNGLARARSSQSQKTDSTVVRPLHADKKKSTEVEDFLPSDARERIRTSVREVIQGLIQEEVQRVLAEELAKVSSDQIRELLKKVA